MANLAAKLLDVQANCPTLGFDAKNPHFKNSYVTLGKVLETVLPLLQERGVLLTQPLSNTPFGPAIYTRFTDTETGEVIEDAVPLVLEKDSPQAAGSAITYFRRYGILSGLGLVGDEDDDAESATTVGSTSYQQSPANPVGKPSF